MSPYDCLHLCSSQQMVACRHLDAATGGLSQRKRLSLGTKPITLRPLVVNGATHVFAASDRPTIIHSSNNKLVYSNLNEQHVRPMFCTTCQLGPQHVVCHDHSDKKGLDSRIKAKCAAVLDDALIDTILPT